jgi:glycosyltransferase involved in cell wall biosynthesis
MRVAMVGTRGVPARYGGFETAIQEIGSRLVERGHEVLVYCRGAESPRPVQHLGMELVHLPAARRKTLETLSHTALSVGHLSRHRRRFDAVIVFNAANAPFLPLIRALRLPVAVHVDGLEWQRWKWQGARPRN